MGYIKISFKILFIIQLIACALAYYGHPDAETIDFGSPSQISREEAIIKAAINRGMDADAVTELLRTKQPVTKTVTTPDGATKTTTYKLEPDGSISRKTIIEKRNRYVYNSANGPDAIPNDKTKPTSGLENDDWFNKPFPSWPDYEPPARSDWFSTIDKPATYGITRIFNGPNGEKRVIQKTVNNPAGSKFPKIGDINWPSFDESSDDWEVLDSNPNAEVTTKKSFPAWTPKSWDWPEFTTPTTSTTTKTTIQSKVLIEPEHNTHKSLPSLEDFLKSQYGPSTTTAKTHTFSSTTRTTPITTTSTTATTKTPKQPTIINVEDLPVVQVLHNGKPANDSILKSLPPHLKPTMQTEQVLKVEHKHPIEEDIEVLTPKVETNIRTYSKTLTGSEKPTLKDLDPHMQEVLRKAGINPEDISNIEGDTITKTRKEPDGRIITTTYKVNSKPVEHTEPVIYTPPQFSRTHSFDTFTPFRGSHTPLTPFASNISPISEFLAKFGLTKFDIRSQNGHYTKTLIDENGDVLTATFVLSSPKIVNNSEPPKPYK